MRQRPIAIVVLLALCGCGDGDSMTMHRKGPLRGFGRNVISTPGLRGVYAPPALSYPPDGFEMRNGTWGTDAAENRVLVLTGERSIGFLPTSNLALLQHDSQHLAPVQEGRNYKARAVFQADSVTGGNTVLAYVYWLRADRVSEISSSTIWAAVATTARAWQRAETMVTAPGGAVYSRIAFGRAAASFSVVFDEVDMLPAVPLWDVYRSSSQAIATGTGATIVYDLATTLVDCTLSTGVITISVGGYYAIKASTEFLTLNDADTASISLRVNASTSYTGDVRTVYAPGGAGTGLVYLHVYMPAILLQAGDTVDVRVAHDYGADRDIAGLGAQGPTLFTGTRIM